MSDLVHDPAQFESRSWIVIGMGYKPTTAELMEAPRSRRESGVTDAISVAVWKTGRTGSRVQVYASLTAAMTQHGRWVRTSLETRHPQSKGLAIEAYAEKRGDESMKEKIEKSEKKVLVRFGTGLWVRYNGGNLEPTKELSEAWPFGLAEAEIVAKQIGGGIFSLTGDPLTFN